MKTLFGLVVVLFFTPAFAQPFPGLGPAIESGDSGHLKAVLISRGGELVFEEYYRGNSADDLQVMNSVTKSVGSALIGIAHRKGRIQLDDTLNRFFADRYDVSTPWFQNKSSMTVEQVLQQRHGIEWDELSVDYLDPANPMTAMFAASDWYEFMLRQPMATAPGESFAYSTGVSTLMSRMIRVISGVGPDEFAMQEFFRPLGIESVLWEGSDGTGRRSGFNNWPNPDRDPPLGFSLWLRPRDMLTIGELYLNGGVHQGRRILDKSWIEATRMPHSNADNSDFFADRPNSGYGYQWWTGRLTDTRDRTWQMFYASGWGRQHILIVPELDLVVVSVANDYDYDGDGIGALMNQFVLPELAPLIDQRFDGAWYNPETDGQGFTFQVLENGTRLLGFWYTYDESGNQRWFMLDGTITDSEADLSIIETRGGVFLQGDTVELTEWGRGRLITIDCDHVTLEITSEEVTTTIPLTRLTGECSGVL